MVSAWNEQIEARFRKEERRTPLQASRYGINAVRFDLGDADFRVTLVGWLRELSDEVIVDLNLVFDQLPGVYPTTLLKLWHRELQRRGLTPRGTEQYLASDVGEPDDQLPVGHPVDYDWRFT